MNPHDTVRVKLTEAGKAILLKEHDITHDECVRRGCVFRPTPPTWDKDGWIEGTFWQLMRSFSSCWVLGANVPFTQLEAKLEEINLGPKFLEQDDKKKTEQKNLISAAKVAPGEAWYEVACAVDHPTLKPGDIVKMVESPQYENFLLRDDYTLHNLQGGSEQYVVLALPEEL